MYSYLIQRQLTFSPKKYQRIVKKLCYRVEYSLKENEALTVRHRVAGHQEVDAGSAGSMADQRHVRRVPAEIGDVLLDPVQRRDLVHQPVIRR